MQKKNKYFALTQTEKEANISIYGDITSWEWCESDVSSYTLSKVLDYLPETIENINVYINSYGGEVAEGLAIYNALKRQKAKVTTYCDGFACSIASVIFMAGDERVMSNASLLMIHNAWSYAQGNANDFRKQADDLDIITQASINAYMNNINITEEELKEMLDNEKWIECNEALEKGFITTIVNQNTEKVSQSVKKSLMKIILEQQQLRTNLLNVIEKNVLEGKSNQEKESVGIYQKQTEEERKENSKKDEEQAQGLFFNLLKVIGGN